jgi:hypothetical protein
MPQPLAIISASLDAVQYFLVSSSLIIGVTALLFFGLGLWLGYLLWGIYKKQFLRSTDTIEVLKNELAMVKRALAEPAARSVVAKAAQPSPLPLMLSRPTPIQELDIEPLPTLVTPALPPSKAFSVWTELDWKPLKIKTKKLPASHAFTLWTNKITKVSKALPADTFSTSLSQTHSSVIMPAVAELTSAESITAQPVTPDIILPVPVQPGPAIPVPILPEPAIAVPVAPEPVWPRGQGWSLWTAPEWQPSLIATQPLHSAAGFSLWSGEDFVPRACGPALPSVAHSLWTEDSWTPLSVSVPPLPASAACSLWTEADYQPRACGPVLPGKGFTLWTLPDWSAPRTLNPPRRSARSFTLWTEPEWMPVVKPLPPAASFTVWTEAETLAIKPALKFTSPSQAFSLWLEDPVSAAPAAPLKSTLPSQTAMVAAAAEAVRLVSAPAAAGPPVEAQEVSFVAAPVHSIAEAIAAPRKDIVKQSFIARTIAAAKQALGINGHDKTFVNIAETRTNSPAEINLPESRAFTLWTETTPSSGALASIIGSSSANGQLLEETSPPPSQRLGSAIESFTEELQSGAVRNDFLLGIVYKEKPSQVDDLTKLNGVAETLQRRLHNHGVYTFKQIAHWNHEQMECFSQRLGSHDRIRRERWIDQARELLEKGGS